MSIHRDVFVRCDLRGARCRVNPQIASPGRNAREARQQARDLDGFRYRHGVDMCTNCWEDIRVLVVPPDELPSDTPESP